MSTDKNIAVSVRDIHKEFVLPQSKNTSFKQAAVNIVKKNNKVTQKVLDGVSFDIHKGDFFGIVGRNGSGKSTLLKLLAGVYSPTSGSIELSGGLTPFIELGVGFNPELSGRDNVYLNGALLGFTRPEMDAMYDEIVEFAELGPFMGQKLKNYSSGMQVRLAFSIAIKAKNDILIFDEVLAVGDEAFQRKCLDVFEMYKAEKQTVVLVTHDMETVKKFCNNSILIQEGKILDQGNPHEVADHYSRLNQEVLDAAQKGEKNGDASIVAHSFRDDNVTPARSYAVNEQMSLQVSWSDVSSVSSVMFDIFRQSGEHVTGFNTARENIKIRDSYIHLKMTATLSPGKYYFMIETRDHVENRIETNYHALDFTIKPQWPADAVPWSGMMPIPHQWL